MKTPNDPRHKKRQHLLEELFKSDFLEQHVSESAKLIMDNRQTLDDHIQRAAPEFPVNKINKVDLAILRLATYEIVISKKELQKVVIDEAVELAKEYGGETSPAFINGALGNILKHATNEQAPQGD